MLCGWGGGGGGGGADNGVCVHVFDVCGPRLPGVTVWKIERRCVCVCKGLSQTVKFYSMTLGSVHHHITTQFKVRNTLRKRWFSEFTVCYMLR